MTLTTTARATVAARTAGGGLIAFGGAAVIGWLVMAFLFRNLVIDVAAVAVVVAGFSVSRGSVLALRFGRALMAAYALAAVVAAGWVGLEAAGTIPWHFEVIPLSMMPTLAVLAVVFGWSLYNLGLLARV